MATSSNCRVPIGAGIGLRLAHIAEIVATRPPARWLEIHPENFLANPHATELLLEVRRHYPISVHTVGVSIGSAGGIDRAHLRRVRALIDRIDPVLVSGHLAWSTHANEYLNDLLPLPYDEETLRLLARHVDEVQEGLGRPYLVENPSSYVGFGNSTMSEVEFLEDRNTLRLEVRKILEDLLNQEEKIDLAARHKIENQKRTILEGSQEWDILYRKYYNEEVKKLGV